MSQTTTILDQETQAVLLDIDATLSTMHAGVVEITEHPVEEGADIADHVRPKPETVALEGLVSNTPVTAAMREAGGGKFPAGVFGRAETAYQVLRNLKDAGLLLTVVTRMVTYENMVIASLSSPALPGDAVKFSVSFKRIQFATTQTIKVTDPIAAKVSTGKQVAKKVTAVEVNKSWAASITDTVGDVFKGAH